MSAVWKFVKSRRENVFMMLMVGSVASELMWIIRMRNEREAFDSRTSTELKVMDRVITKVTRGEKVDLNHELMQKDSNETVDDILANLHKLDQQWRAETVKDQQDSTNQSITLPRATDNSSANGFSIGGSRSTQGDSKIESSKFL